MKQAKLSFAGRASNPVKASPAQLAARKRFAEMARSGAFKKTAKRKTNPVDTFIEKFHLGGKIYAQIIEKSDGTFDYYVYQMQATGIPGEKPYEQFFDSKNYKTKSGAMRGLEKWAMRHQYKVTPQLHTNPVKKTIKRKANTTMRPIIKAALNIRELAYDLENISQDDKKQISDYTDAEILHEAKYVLEIYHESGTVSNDALMGEHGKDEQKSARDDVRKLKALIKKLSATTPRKTNPTKKTVSQKISQLVHEGYPQRQAVAVALSEQRAGKVKRNPMGEIQAYAITRNFKVLGIFQTKQDAIKAAQGISDATGKTLAIKPVQVMAGHFNK
jgi:hypothetical protein